MGAHGVGNAEKSSVVSTSILKLASLCLTEELLTTRIVANRNPVFNKKIIVLGDTILTANHVGDRISLPL